MEKLTFDDADMDTPKVLQIQYGVYVRASQEPGAYKYLQTRKMLQDVSRVWSAPSRQLTTRSNNVARCCVKLLLAFSRGGPLKALGTNAICKK